MGFIQSLLDLHVQATNQLIMRNAKLQSNQKENGNKMLQHATSNFVILSFQVKMIFWNLQDDETGSFKSPLCCFKLRVSWE